MLIPKSFFPPALIVLYIASAKNILPDMIKVSSYLSPKRLTVTAADSKTAALLKVLDLFRDCPQILDYNRFVKEILQREAMLATNLGDGIGAPHVRSSAVREPVAALGVLTSPVDYGGIGQLPVNIVLIVGMPENANEAYLRYIARVSYIFSKPEIRTAVGACRTAEELSRLISLY